MQLTIDPQGAAGLFLATRFPQAKDEDVAVLGELIVEFCKAENEACARLCDKAIDTAPPGSLAWAIRKRIG